MATLLGSLVKAFSRSSRSLGGAVAHQAGEIIALAGDLRARGARREGLDEAAEKPVGEPVADDLNLVDVVVREGRDEAAAEAGVLRARARRRQGGGEGRSEPLWRRRASRWLAPEAGSAGACRNPLGDAAVFPLRRPSTRRKHGRKRLGRRPSGRLPGLLDALQAHRSLLEAAACHLSSSSSDPR